jgi:hypothetical protein
MTAVVEDRRRIEIFGEIASLTQGRQIFGLSRQLKLGFLLRLSGWKMLG